MNQRDHRIIKLIDNDCGIVKASLSILMVISSLIACMGQAKDTLYMHRNQMLLGEVLSVTEGRLEFDSDDAGVVKVKYYKIRTFSAGIHYYRIRTTDAQILYGRIYASENDGFIRINNDKEIPIESIIRLQRYEDSFLERLNGKISAGYDYTRSSDIGRINFDLIISYLAQDLEVNVTASSILTQEGNSFNRDIENINISPIYYLNYRWLVAARLRYQRNLELSLARRFQEFVGAGIIIIQKANMQIVGLGGLAMNQELSTEGLASGNLLELPVILSFKLYQFQNPDIQLSINQSLYIGITQSGRVRNDGEIRLSWEAISDFIIGLTFYNNYDNQPPEGISNRTFDFGTVLSVGYKFN